MKISAYKILTFDSYGTLIDWETGILEALAAWRRHHSLRVDDADILASFGRFEAAEQAANPKLVYPSILARVAAQIGAAFGAPLTTAEADAFGRSLAEWPAFGDSAGELGYLKQHFKLVVLSNVDRASFAVSNRKLGVEFDAIYTAQDIGSYKPNSENFIYLLNRLAEMGHNKSEILHVAQSLFHDHEPAKALGMTTVWIDRWAESNGSGATRRPDGTVEPDMRFESLAQFADAHRQELNGPES